MRSEVDNKIIKSTINGPYAGRDQYNQYIIMLEDREREFVVTHNANIKPVAYFTGRETELNDLRQRVEEGRKSVLVSGMGGIGKTHICRKLFEEYLTKHADGEDGPFKHIGYVEYSGDMGSSLQNCLKYKEQADQKLNQEAAWRELSHLASNGKLLLFVDNVDKSMREDPGLQRLNSIPGAVVLTSRRISFSDGFEPYRIGFLSIEQCMEIYENIRFEDSEGKVKVKPEELPDLEYIIEKLVGKHTLTINHLAHLARTKTWTVSRLREELEQKGFQLKFHKNGEPINIQEEYVKLYDLSKLTEAEQNILEAFSIFPYIPLDAKICNQWLLADAGVSDDDDILMGLYQKGWLQFNIEQESYAMHPVFAQFIYDKCKPKMENHMELIELCQKNVDTTKGCSVGEVLLYIPFAENIFKKVDMKNVMRQVEFVSVLAHAIDYLYRDRHEALRKIENWYRGCLKILLEIGDENQIEVINIYEHMAKIFSEQEEYEKAKELYEKSIELRTKISGENHCNVATSCAGLAMIYWLEKDYVKAEELCLKSACIREQVLGVCAITINSYANLAEIYIDCEKYTKAEELYLKVINLWEIMSDGKEVSAIAECYNELAIACYHQKRIQTSLDYFIKAYVTFLYGFNSGDDFAISDIIYKNMQIAYAEWNPEGNFEQWIDERMKEAK